MSWVAIMIGVCGAVWGGFVVLLIKALRAERSGRHRA